MGILKYLFEFLISIFSGVYSKVEFLGEREYSHLEYGLVIAEDPPKR